MDADRIRSLREVAEAVATGASQRVMKGFGTLVQVETKAYGEAFTKFDIESEQFVRGELGRLTPDIPVVGEEQGGEPSEGLTWFIDPIDGTNNFIAGQPFFCVSLGLCQAERPVVGAVVAPALGLTWTGNAELLGVPGMAFKNGSVCRVSRLNQLSETIVTTGFPARALASDVAHLRRLGALTCATRDVRRCGSAAIELCMVADGTYGAYWMRKLNPWDTSAGAAIVEGAGGRFHANLASPDGPVDVATNGQLDAELATMLEFAIG